LFDARDSDGRGNVNRRGIQDQGFGNSANDVLDRLADLLLAMLVDEDGVEITDDGRGPRPEADGRVPGHGLAGLRERAEALGASLTTGASAEGGFRLRVGW
jgi:two-component system sensor histidine kinase DesK